MTKTRTETDSFGPLEVPADKYWGAQTPRSLMNFRIGTETMPVPLIRAFGIIKRAAALANKDLGKLDPRLADAIAAAAQDVIDGKLDDNFPLVVWQTGSGTQTNMNANEVISNRAIEILGGKIGLEEPIHPNDHVNMSQSSNDSFPTAMHIAAAEAIVHRARARPCRSCAALMNRKATQLRPHHQDRPHAYAGRHAADARPGVLRLCGAGRIRHPPHQGGSDYLFELAQGGTAVGTGLNCPPGFAERFAEHRGGDHRPPLPHRPQQVRGARRP